MFASRIRALASTSNIKPPKAADATTPKTTSSASSAIDKEAQDQIKVLQAQLAKEKKRAAPADSNSSERVS